MQELTWVAVGRAAGWVARSGSLWIAWYHGDPCPELPGNSGPWRSLGLMGALGGGAGIGRQALGKIQPQGAGVVTGLGLLCTLSFTFPRMSGNY